MHPVTIVQALILLAVQLAVGNLGREDARSLLNETFSDGLAGTARSGSTNQPTDQQGRKGGGRARRAAPTLRPGGVLPLLALGTISLRGAVARKP